MSKENLFEPGKVRLYSGRYVDVTDISVEDISIVDIASGLAKKPRFNGQGKTCISLAMHSILVASMSDNKLGGLLHDAHEAYLFDIPTPFKKLSVFEPIVGLENKIQKTINYAFDIKDHYTDDVRLVDKQVLKLEWELLITRDILKKQLRHDCEADMLAFLRYFCELTDDLEIEDERQMLVNQRFLASRWIVLNGGKI